MKLDSGPKRACSAPKGIPLRSPPGAPFDHDIVTEGKNFLSEPPLQFLYSLAAFTVPKTNPESIHPIVGTETHSPQLLLNLLRMCCLARTRQATDDDESRTALAFPRQFLSAPNSIVFCSTGPVGGEQIPTSHKRVALECERGHRQCQPARTSFPQSA